MAFMRKSIREIENQFDRRAEWLAFHHPCLALLFWFIGLPMLVLIGVFVSTCSIALPLVLLFGWL